MNEQPYYFLFKNPSVIDGIASNIDLFGVYDDYNNSPSAKFADSVAIYSDFVKVGEDIKSAINVYEQGKKA